MHDPWYAELAVHGCMPPARWATFCPCPSPAARGLLHRPSISPIPQPQIAPGEQTTSVSFQVQPGPSATWSFHSTHRVE